MTLQRLETLIRKKPFVPFRIHTADGDIIEVKSPEFIWLHPKGRVVYVASSSEQDEYDRIIDLLLISQLSTLNGTENPFPQSKSDAG